MPRISDDVVIVGIGETPVGALPGWNAVQIQAMAVLEALKDCGLDLCALDGLINLDPYSVPQSMFSSTLMEYLGLKPSFVSTVDVGGTVTSMTMLQQAVWAIDAGHCEVAVVVYGENNKTNRPRNTQGLFMKNLLGGEEWEEPFGMQGLLIPYALLAQRYLDLYRVNTDGFAEIAVTTRRHALLNPNAYMKKPITVEDYHNSRMISTPIRLLDSSLVADGGGALVLTTRKRARKLGLKEVTIASMAMRATHNSIAQVPDIPEFGMGEAGKDALESAGVGPKDIDIAELHDAFTVSVMITLEALGFCPAGEGSAYVASGATALGGRCPVNTHGGLLSQGHIGGILHVVEAVRQLRGEAGPRQVENARHAIVSGNGGSFSVCGAMVLRSN